MKVEKLEKYKLGNFVLKEKHIYAKNKLIQISKKLLEKALKKQYGGASTSDASKPKFDSVSDDIRKMVDDIDIKKKDDVPDGTEQDEGIDTGVVDSFFDALNKDEKLKKLFDTDEKKDILKELKQADTDLVNSYNTFKTISTTHALKNDTKTRETLLNIQKELFALQSKIIFSKLTSIPELDLSGILEPIYNKIQKMNNFMEKVQPISNKTEVAGTNASSNASSNASTNASSNVSSNASSNASTTVDTNNDIYNKKIAELKTTYADIIDTNGKIIVNDENKNKREALRENFEKELLTATTKSQITEYSPNEVTISTTKYNNKTAAELYDSNPTIKAYIDFFSEILNDSSLKNINTYDNILDITGKQQLNS